MTLVISTLTSSGIVLTADSRQTYRNQVGAPRIGSDSATKLFKLTDSCGVAISGRAFLSEKDQPAKDVGYSINKFAENEDLKDLSVKQIADNLNKYLSDIFIASELGALKKQIEGEVKKNNGTELKIFVADGNMLPYSFKDKDGKIQLLTGFVESINMIVAGVDKDNIGRAYSVFVSKGVTVEKNTEQCGALWVGQTDVLARIVRGYAPEIGNLEFIKDVSKNDKSILDELNKLEYVIKWATITLQDAIDFCVLMTRTTESIQRFSDGTYLSPGGIPGVGGEIDIAIITPEKGFLWLKKKSLKSEGAELSLDK